MAEEDEKRKTFLLDRDEKKVHKWPTLDSHRHKVASVLLCLELLCGSTILEIVKMQEKAVQQCPVKNL